MSEEQKKGWVEVFASKEGMYAQMVASLLESEGFSVTVDHVLTNVIPGHDADVSLMVPAREADDAIKMLREAGYLPQEEGNVLLEVKQARRQLWKKIGASIAVVLLLLLLLMLYIYLTPDPIS